MHPQMSFWNHYTVYNTHRNGQTKTSEKRQRTERITVRLLPSERAALNAAAQRARVSVSELIRTSALQMSEPFPVVTIGNYGYIAKPGWTPVFVIAMHVAGEEHRQIVADVTDPEFASLLAHTLLEYVREVEDAE